MKVILRMKNTETLVFIINTFANGFTLLSWRNYRNYPVIIIPVTQSTDIQDIEIEMHTDDFHFLV